MFDFIARAGPVEVREMYATFNMGVGLRRLRGGGGRRPVRGGGDGGGVRRLGRRDRGGEGGRKAVEIGPLGITFEGDTLNVR